jgi:hypothetical protein
MNGMKRGMVKKGGSEVNRLANSPVGFSVPTPSGHAVYATHVTPADLENS